MSPKPQDNSGGTDHQKSEEEEKNEKLMIKKCKHGKNKMIH